MHAEISASGAIFCLGRCCRSRNHIVRLSIAIQRQCEGRSCPNCAPAGSEHGYSGTDGASVSPSGKPATRYESVEPPQAAPARSLLQRASWWADLLRKGSCQPQLRPFARGMWAGWPVRPASKPPHTLLSDAPRSRCGFGPGDLCRGIFTSRRGLALFLAAFSTCIVVYSAILCIRRACRLAPTVQYAQRAAHNVQTAKTVRCVDRNYLNESCRFSNRGSSGAATWYALPVRVSVLPTYLEWSAG